MQGPALLMSLQPLGQSDGFRPCAYIHPVNSELTCILYTPNKRLCTRQSNTVRHIQHSWLSHNMSSTHQHADDALKLHHHQTPPPCVPPHSASCNRTMRASRAVICSGWSCDATSLLGLLAIFVYVLFVTMICLCLCFDYHHHIRSYNHHYIHSYIHHHHHHIYNYHHTV